MRLLQGWMVASLALCWALLLVFLLRMVVRHMNGVNVLPANFRHASAGVWYAPAILLPFNPAGITAAVVLVIGATRLLCSTSDGVDWSYSGARVLGAGELSIDALPRHLAPALAVSAGLQGAVCLMLLGHSASAMGLLSASVAVLSAIAIALGAWGESRPPDLPRSVLGLCLTFMLAMLAGHLLGGGGFGFGRGSGTSAFFGPPGQPVPRPEADPLARIGPEKAKPPEAPTPPPGATGEVLPDVNFAGPDVPGSFPGVILWPDVKPEITLVEPFPTRGGSGPPALARPFIIPFGGEYWMYRWPFARPPRSSYFRRGTPAKLAFSTTDRTPLEMEALQKLDRTINLNCCSKIEVSVQNADYAAAGIRLELVVIDNDPPYKSPLSLGMQPLRGVPAPGTPLLETLDYPVPVSPRLAKFDEIKVVFHRDPKHQDHSARVAVERFTLIP